jgi:AcrR family transcriptional regulator
MTPTPPSRGANGSHESSIDSLSVRTSILDAGLDIVCDSGLSSLTLRPLGERAGLSVGAVTHHLGAKDAVLVQLVEYARLSDRAWRSRWSPRIASMAGAPAPIRAALVDLALEDLVSSGRRCSILFCELIQATGLPEDVRAELAAWLGELENFWAGMAGSSGSGVALQSFVVDELAYGLSLNGCEPYRLLRRLCLHRMFAGADIPADEHSAIVALLKQIQTELAPERSVVDARIEGAGEDKRAVIARAAGRLIVETGAGGITHRAVAAAANVPPSTVVYHFGASEDLMLAGLEAVIGAFHQWWPGARAREAGEAGAVDEIAQTRSLVRATCAIALGAVHHDRLVPHAADMRRRRGENVRPVDLGPCPEHVRRNFDALSGQVVSTVSFGARMIAMALNQDEGDWVRRARADLFRVW